MKIFVFDIPSLNYKELEKVLISDDTARLLINKHTNEGEVVKVLAGDEDEAIRLLIHNSSITDKDRQIKLAKYYKNCLRTVFCKPQIISATKYQ